MSKSRGKQSASRSRRLNARKQKTKKRTKKTIKRKQRKLHSRRMRGGAPLPPVYTYPPGGSYVPGAINGVDGGYYYGLLTNPCLPDPKSINNLRGGGVTNYMPWGLQNLTRASIHDIQKFIAAYRGTPAPSSPFPMQDSRIGKN